MLPTKGYFQDIDCPYYDSTCGRPYCHFRHKKKHQESGNDSPKESEVPTYKPTPKSQLANNRSHIPISYVPDLTFRPERTRNVQKFIRDKPIYKPTPLSVLSSVNKQDNRAGVNDTEKVIEKETKQAKDDQESREEYDPSEDIDISVHYTPTSDLSISAKDHSQNAYKPSGDISNIEYKPTSSSDSIERADTHYTLRNDEQNTIEYHPTPNLDSELNSSIIDFEDLDNEFDMIDEIISDNNTSPIDEQENIEKDKSDKASDSKQNSSESRKDKLLPRVKESDKLQKESRKHTREDIKSKSHKNYSKVKCDDKTAEKSKHGKYESGKKSNKHSEEQDKKERGKSRHSESKHESKSKSSSSNSKHKSHHREKEEKERHREKKHSSKDMESSHKHHQKAKKSSKEKSYKHNKEKKHKTAKTDDKHKKRNKSESQESDTSNGNSVANNECDDDDDDHVKFEIDSEDEDTMEECYRIFNEYKPPEQEAPTEKPTQQKGPIENETFTGKKRIAHTNTDKITPKLQGTPVNPLPSAAQIMTSRFKIARAAQASNEQVNIMEEVKQLSSLKRPAPPSLAAAVKSYKIQKTIKDAQLNKASTSSVVDDIISSTQKTNSAIAKFSQRRIAPVTNVSLMQKAKERIEEMKQRVIESEKKTTAQTVKGSKRIAHVPEFSLADIPDVLQADKSKLPVNVRTRFLTMLADECVKLYLTKEDAYTRALNEEFACYEKCKVLATYKNSAMLAVNRVRKEHQERTKQGLGPIYSQEESSSDRSSQFKGRKFHNNIKRYILTDEELDIHGYPKESKIPGKAVIKNRKAVALMPLKEHQRKCARCSKIYVVDEDGFAFYDEECLYHPLKKRTLRGEQTYLCCKSSDDSGCCTSHTHVSECTDDTDLEGFQVTMEAETDDDPRSIAVYALDCEMCYTTKGLELTRVTIVDSECKTVYDSLVKPLNPIIDYNTRFSGITKEQMDRTSTSILQVQANILHLCNSETILIGHSLESDMKALKIIHGNIIDTSVLFPHRLGLPHKRALRALASEYLKKIIQNDISGHDSAEDAITCMELIKWKLKEELKVRGVK